MALIFIDSFDHYATADLSRKWTSVIGAPTVGAYGRNGTSGLRCNPASSGAGDGAFIGFDAAASGLIGFAIYASLAESLPFLAAFDGGNNGTQFGLRLATDGSITAYRCSSSYGGGAYPLDDTSATVLGTSAGGVIQEDVWHYLECQATIHDTTGAIEVRVDGVAVLTLANVDNKRTATAQLTSWYLGSRKGASANRIDFDDVYVADTTGGVNDDFLGDVRVDAHLPNGAGSTTAWTASAGNNYACVDEAAPNDDTDYVSTDTINNVDTYAFPNLANAGGAIQGLQVLACCLKEDAGACSLAPVVRPVATDRVGTTAAIGTTYAYHVRECYDVSPETGIAWTEDEFNASEFGVKKIV